MGVKGGLEMNTADFDIRFPAVRKEIQGLTGRAAMRVGSIVIRDSIKEEPRAPHLTGALKRSKAILKWQDDERATEVRVGFQIEYAAYQHEGLSMAGVPLKYKKPGSGAKFMSTKLVRNADRYRRYMADFIATKGTATPPGGTED